MGRTINGVMDHFSAVVCLMGLGGVFNGDVSQWQWVVRLLDGSRWCCGWLCCRLCWWVEVVGCGFVVVRLLGNGGRLGGWYAVG